MIKVYRSQAWKFQMVLAGVIVRAKLVKACIWRCMYIRRDLSARGSSISSMQMKCDLMHLRSCSFGCNSITLNLDYKRRHLSLISTSWPTNLFNKHDHNSIRPNQIRTDVDRVGSLLLNCKHKICLHSTKWRQRELHPHNTIFMHDDFFKIQD